MKMKYSLWWVLIHLHVKQSSANNEETQQSIISPPSLLYKWTDSTLQAPEIYSICQPLVSPAALSLCVGTWVYGGERWGVCECFNAVCGRRRWMTLRLKHLSPAGKSGWWKCRAAAAGFCFLQEAWSLKTQESLCHAVNMYFVLLLCESLKTRNNEDDVSLH